MWNQLRQQISGGDTKALSRVISLVENEVSGYEGLLQELPYNDHVKVTGITGPPGAGKSTIVDLLIGRLCNAGKRVAVICVDPSSPFTKGAILGDRIRMREWYNNPLVLIRSIATRGTLGGLNQNIMQICDVIKAANYDHIIIETVGVGQSEIEIAAIADTTVVVQVPESGDDIQTMKAGLMEIADIFVVNKADRPDADLFIKNLRSMMLPHIHIPVIKMVASAKQGIAELESAITTHIDQKNTNKKISILTDRLCQLVLKRYTKKVNRKLIESDIRESYGSVNFNLYRMAEKY